jgi:hypothetical protein
MLSAVHMVPGRQREPAGLGGVGLIVVSHDWPPNRIIQTPNGTHRLSLAGRAVSAERTYAA